MMSRDRNHDKSRALSLLISDIHMFTLFVAALIVQLQNLYTLKME